MRATSPQPIIKLKCLVFQRRIEACEDHVFISIVDVICRTGPWADRVFTLTPHRSRPPFTCGTEQRLDAIAAQVGYQDTSAFGRAFTRTMKLSPSQYR